MKLLHPLFTLALNWSVIENISRKILYVRISTMYLFIVGFPIFHCCRRMILDKMTILRFVVISTLFFFFMRWNIANSIGHNNSVHRIYLAKVIFLINITMIMNKINYSADISMSRHMTNIRLDPWIIKRHAAPSGGTFKKVHHLWCFNAIRFFLNIIFVIFLRIFSIKVAIVRRVRSRPSLDPHIRNLRSVLFNSAVSQIVLL